MAVRALYQRHSAGLAATYAEVETQAASQSLPLLGSPGSITLRSNGAGARYYVRQYYDFGKAKRDDYIVAAAAPDADKILEGWKARIAEANDAAASVRLLAREGYQTLPPRHVAAIAPLVRHGLFEAGALLVGSHALGIVLNRLGIRAEPFATEDLDIARPQKLALPHPRKWGLAEILRESGIDFVAVPPLDHGGVSTKFKERGRSRFTFDVLVPAPGREQGVVEVPELGVYATALPYLRYLVAESQPGTALSTQGILPVRVPLPERFALHKLAVSQMRVGRPEKALKDQRQATILIASLGELHPGALAEAYAAIPTSMRSLVRKAFEQVRAVLEAHPASLDEMERSIKG